MIHFVLICKFLIMPTQSNDTGSDNGKQPAASSQRQRALTLTATGFMVYIQHLSSPSHKHPQYMYSIVYKYIRFTALLL